MKPIIYIYKFDRESLDFFKHTFAFSFVKIISRESEIIPINNCVVFFAFYNSKFKNLNNDNSKSIINIDLNCHLTKKQIFDFLSNLAGIELLTIVIPTQFLDEKQVNKLLASFKNYYFVKRIILVTDKGTIDKIDKYLKNLPNLLILESEVGTKISKLKLTKKYISSSDYVLIMDGDDTINPNFTPNYWGFDLYFSNYYRTNIDNNKNEEKTIIEFNRIFLNWGKHGGQPYFGNHSTIVKGNIYNRFLDIVVNFDFQRHEDAIRSLYYISYSKNIFYSEALSDIPIIRQMSASYNHASRVPDNITIGKWISQEIKLLNENPPKLSSELFLRKSQLASINEVNNTFARLKNSSLIDENIRAFDLYSDEINELLKK